MPIAQVIFCDTICFIDIITWMGWELTFGFDLFLLKKLFVVPIYKNYPSDPMRKKSVIIVGQRHHQALSRQNLMSLLNHLAT